MTRTMECLGYKAFGLHILSEIPLPELPRTDQPGIMGSISVAYGSLEERWKAVPKITPSLGAAENEVMFIVKDTAIFSVHSGSRITVSPVPEADPDSIRLFILGSCMGVLLMQKGILALHGSSLVLNNQAYALVGRSGAGKSTLASYLMDQGHLLVSDDVIPVLVQNGHPLAVPGYPQQKLWQQSLDYLGMNSSVYRPLFQRETKFAVPVHDRFQAEPLPLAGIFELTVSPDGPVALEPIIGLERLHTLYNHTYQKALVDRIGVREWHFGMLASFAGRLPMYRLTRPEQGFSAPQQTELIFEVITQKVKEMNA
ncbi:aldolase [Paenibacillus sp. MMS20-IR301]|uniref:aldolase n=1 Tax=Paenibacillus sp. MMS20-IR301 TaxID=2895946 RepID=UPI0028EA868C|nr:aldolase [Paenibacillus sp. MMS20-IR301]WNS41448.1 aldolase [Paenibacillus sp. MMS20-IR301]